MTPRAPFLLPLLRIALLGFLVPDRFWELGRQLTAIAKRPAVLHAPVLDVLGLPFPPPAWFMSAAPWLLVTSGVLAVLGLCTRPALAVLCGTWLYCGALEAGWGFYNHTPALPFQVTLVLLLAPGTTAYSLDRVLVARWRKQPRTEWAPPAPPWGEWLACLVIGAFYFSAGVSKLRYGAGAWLSGESLSFYLSGAALEQFWFGPKIVDAAQAWKDSAGIVGYVYMADDTPVGRFLASHRWMCALLSWLTLAVELGAPFCLLAAARVRGAYIVVLQLFHVGMALLIGPRFFPWMVAAGCVFPWRELVAWARPRVLAWRTRRMPRAM